MTQNLFLYWQRLTHRPGDERAEAPVLDLAGCFGSPVITTPRLEAMVARLADAAPARVELR